MIIDHGPHARGTRGGLAKRGALGESPTVAQGRCEAREARGARIAGGTRGRPDEYRGTGAARRAAEVAAGHAGGPPAGSPSLTIPNREK